MSRRTPFLSSRPTVNGSPSPAAAMATGTSSPCPPRAAPRVSSPGTPAMSNPPAGVPMGRRSFSAPDAMRRTTPSTRWMSPHSALKCSPRILRRSTPRAIRPTAGRSPTVAMASTGRARVTPAPPRSKSGYSTPSRASATPSPRMISSIYGRAGCLMEKLFSLSRWAKRHLPPAR